MCNDLRQNIACKVRVVGITVALLLTVPSARALTFDFTGSTVAASSVRSFIDVGSGVGLVVSAGSLGGPSFSPPFSVLVTQQAGGLGVRSQPFVSSDGDGLLDSDGSSESLSFAFLDSSGNDLDVILDTIVFSFFDTQDDVSLSVDGSNLVGPDFALPAATWNLGSFPAADRTSNNFALSTTPDAAPADQDDLRVAAINFSIASVPEPGTTGLLALGLGLLSWRRLAAASRQHRHL